MHKRSSRWTDEPVLDKAGKPLVATIQDSDLPIFKVLNRYRYMRSSYLHKFVPRYHTSLLKRLDLLQSRPNKHLHRPPQQMSQPNANYRHLIYELAPKGEQVLKDLGHWSPEPPFGDRTLFEHSMMVNDTIQSIDLQAKLVFFPQVAPNADRFIRVHVEHQFQSGRQKHSFEYYNDSNGPFAIDYGGSYRFFSLEAEHTNQVDCGNLRRCSRRNSRCIFNSHVGCKCRLQIRSMSSHERGRNSSVVALRMDEQENAGTMVPESAFKKPHYFGFD
jgi:hypothetical protein